MNIKKESILVVILLSLLTLSPAAQAQSSGWKFTGTASDLLKNCKESKARGIVLSFSTFKEHEQLENAQKSINTDRLCECVVAGFGKKWGEDKIVAMWYQDMPRVDDVKAYEQYVQNKKDKEVVQYNCFGEQIGIADLYSRSLLWGDQAGH